MKLRNKKTGEIVELCKVNPEPFEAVDFNCSSIAELNEEWEDIPEEPKEYWFINDLDGTPMKCELRSSSVRDFGEWIKKRKQFGNYFETGEEARQAVEKLKAWKRLKDKGAEFYGWRKNHTGTYDLLARWKGVPPKMQEIINDLDLLFNGGEE